MATLRISIIPLFNLLSSGIARSSIVLASASSGYSSPLFEMSHNDETLVTATSLPDKLVIFDGVCNLCDGTVNFLIAHDPDKVLKFVALQSTAAAPILKHFGLSQEDALKSITFVDDGIAYTKSGAALRISRYLTSPYKYLEVFGCVPTILRDAVYDLVASNRYFLFGKSEVCMRPTKEVTSRFLDAAGTGSKKTA